jgi:hypothetical protein
MLRRKKSRFFIFEMWFSESCLNTNDIQADKLSAIIKNNPQNTALFLPLPFKFAIF